MAETDPSVKLVITAFQSVGNLTITPFTTSTNVIATTENSAQVTVTPNTVTNLVIEKNLAPKVVYPTTPSIILSSAIISGGSGSQGPTGATGSTGATGPTGPVGDYVKFINGISGGVTLYGGTQIGITYSPVGITINFNKTITVKGAAYDIQVANDGVGDNKDLLSVNNFKLAEGTFDLNVPKGLILGNEGYIEFPDGTTQGTYCECQIGPTGPTGATGATGATGPTGEIPTDYVISINGFTGAVSNIFAAGATITNTNSAATWYPTFVGGTGATAFYIDAVTTPLSYQPSQGTINARTFNGTFGSSTAKLDATQPIIFIQDTLSTVAVDPYSLVQSGASTFLISGVGITLESSFGIEFTDNAATPTWAYRFPQSNGSNGQVLTTNGAGTLSWTAISTGISRSISSISTDTNAGSAASTDYVYIATAGLTLTMPTAASNTNLYTIKTTTASTVNIVTTSSQTIDGGTAYYMNKQYDAIGLISDGSNWYRIGL